jgi:hypothetical protein
MDRIINPAGPALNNGKMVNVNIADANLLYEAIGASILDTNPNFVGADGLAAQLAVNIVDLRDYDAQVTILPINSGTYYGFEVQPFISEIAFKISNTAANVSSSNHFAIELYNPFDADIPLGDFKLEIRRQGGGLVGTINLAGYAISDQSRFVVTNGDAASRTFGVAAMMSTGVGKEDPSLELAKYRPLGTDPETYELSERYDVYFMRTTSASDIYLDKQQTLDNWFDWDTVKNIPQYYSRADKNWNIIYQNLEPAINTLGDTNIGWRYSKSIYYGTEC